MSCSGPRQLRLHTGVKRRGTCTTLAAVRSWRRISWMVVSGAAAVGCGAQSWAPPPPSGTTWRYDHQGFQDHNTVVVAGSLRGPAIGVAYGGAFSFREQVGAGFRTGADPLAESTPIDGVKFNEHLSGQGRTLSPATSATIAPVSPVSPTTPPPTPASSTQLAPHGSVSGPPAGEP